MPSWFNPAHKKHTCCFGLCSIMQAVVNVSKHVERRIEMARTKSASNAPQCLNREEVAQRLALSQRMADFLILSGAIRSMKIGKKRLVTEASLGEFIRERELASK